MPSASFPLRHTECAYYYKVLPDQVADDLPVGDLKGALLVVENMRMGVDAQQMVASRR